MAPLNEWICNLLALDLATDPLPNTFYVNTEDAQTTSSVEVGQSLKGLPLS